MSPPSTNPAGPASLLGSDGSRCILGGTAADNRAILRYTVAVCHWHVTHPLAFPVFIQAVRCVSCENNSHGSTACLPKWPCASKREIHIPQRAARCRRTHGAARELGVVSFPPPAPSPPAPSPLSPPPPFLCSIDCTKYRGEGERQEWGWIITLGV